MLTPFTYYHIYNHAIGEANLFRTEGNYNFFLKKYNLYIAPVADTFAYCLMPNHFHLLIRVKPEEELVKIFSNLQPAEKIPYQISKQFSNLFSCYTQSYNKVYSRMGSLFIKNFKRKEINTEEYFRELVCYIHYNPVHHGFTKDFAKWKYSSYAPLLSTEPTLLAREDTIAWFDDIRGFIRFHQRPVYSTKLTFPKL